MKVLVTGASGLIGRAVTADLLEHGYEVRALDKAPLKEELRDRVEMVYAEITDRLAVLRAVEGCEAIIHLAAIPSPGPHVDDILFQTNVTGTQYVFAAAEAHGIKRVALASSCCAFGFVYPPHPFDPQHLKLDENHPDLPQDLYGLSKVFNEETAAAYYRRCGINSVSLRLTMVINFQGKHMHWRRRQFEHSKNHRSPEFWTYIDVRDTARAFRLGIEAEYEGAHKIITAAPDAFTPYDVRELVRQHYPDVPFDDTGVGPNDCLYILDRLKDILGFEAQYSWKDVPELVEIARQVQEEKGKE